MKAPRELVVVIRESAAPPLAASPLGTPTNGGDIRTLVEAAGGKLQRLSGVSVSRLRASLLSPGATNEAAEALTRYYRVDAPAENLETLAATLYKRADVESSFIKPEAEPAVLNTMLPTAAEPPDKTPDFTLRQGYLEQAPAGVDTRFAWTIPGGLGDGVSIIDIEGEWRFSHEDLVENEGGVAGGTPPGDIDWRNHGTAVLGEFHGARNSRGITGICPNAGVRAISVFNNGAAAAIRAAADALSLGDILLIELHYPGPRFNFSSAQGQRGYIPAEWWPDNLAAIQYATQKGILVVEAGGNGEEDLDDPLYDINPAPPFGPFPATWANPFRRGAQDSGAILVGAGAPPPGTHGRNWGPDRSRLDFSNHGSMIDVQGWGREVTTCGYGDLQGGDNEDLWYTDQFSGTSSAAPIIVGVLGCLQGILRRMGRPLLTSAAARSLLRSSGSPQQASGSSPLAQRIGNRPDLRDLILQLGLSAPAAGADNPTVPAHTINIRIGDTRMSRIVNINVL